MRCWRGLPLPITSSVHDLLIMLQRYAVFLYLQNPYLSTSKRCIKMGIPSLNSAILYCVSLYFRFTDPSTTLRITVKSCKYSKIYDSCPRKQPFLWTEHNVTLLFQFEDFLHQKRSKINSGSCRCYS